MKVLNLFCTDVSNGHLINMWNHDINDLIKSTCIINVSIWDKDLLTLEKKSLIS